MEGMGQGAQWEQKPGTKPQSGDQLSKGVANRFCREYAMVGSFLKGKWRGPIRIKGKADNAYRRWRKKPGDYGKRWVNFLGRKKGEMGKREKTRSGPGRKPKSGQEQRRVSNQGLPSGS